MPTSNMLSCGITQSSQDMKVAAVQLEDHADLKHGVARDGPVLPGHACRARGDPAALQLKNHADLEHGVARNSPVRPGHARRGDPAGTPRRYSSKTMPTSNMASRGMAQSSQDMRVARAMSR